jgi:hypothetical protein
MFRARLRERQRGNQRTNESDNYFFHFRLLIVDDVLQAKVLELL